MRSRNSIGTGGLAALILSTLGLVMAGPPAGAVSNVCVVRTPATAGKVSWTIRQASGLTTVAASPGVLFTHNDRGIRDAPAAGEDTSDAAVWAIGLDGASLARFRLVDAAGSPIPYFDTEAISRDPQGRVVLADTGTNVEARLTVVLYRFTPPSVTAGQSYTEADVVAEVIPLAYYANATTSTRTSLNVESMAIAADGDAWFVPRKSGKPFAYVATAAALDQAAGSATPARAQRSTQLMVAGPMTDAAISPDGTMLLVKTAKTVYAYDLRTKTIAAALAEVPCVVATARKAKDPGWGEAIVARDDGGFTTLAEGSKTQHSGLSSAVWSFSV
jgi:hypothetical protein